MVEKASSEARSRAVGGFAAFRLERTHAHLVAQATALLADAVGLTPRQWWIIADMAEMRPRTARDLAALAGVDKGLLSRNLKALAAMGLVKMTRDAKDKRQQILTLTRAGRTAYLQALPVMEARNAALVRNVGADEYRIFLDVLDRIDAASLKPRARE